MMSFHKLSAGDGYEYYLKETASADTKRTRGEELTDYYTVEGNPPGVWMGRGTEHLGVSGTVSEAQMRALFGEGLHPDADEIIEQAVKDGMSPEAAIKAARLGRRYPVYAPHETLSAKIQAEYDRFERTTYREPTKEERQALRMKVAAIAFRDARGRDAVDGEELSRFLSAQMKPTRHAVAGMDCTFSPPKSVSILWAFTEDQELRAGLERVHEKAIAETIAGFEDTSLYSRAGQAGVRQVDVDGGVIVTRFRHYDSRTGDPQLHDHAVISNKVRCADGTWRSIDAQLMYNAVVTMSENYNRLLTEYLGEDLGLATRQRVVQEGKPTVTEIAGIDDETIERHSGRRMRDILPVMKDLVADYVKEHGRQPDTAARIDLAQTANLSTRERKTHRSPAQMMTDWARNDPKTKRNIDRDVAAAAKKNTRTADPDREPVTIDTAAEYVTAVVSTGRATWNVDNLRAEANRYVKTHHAALRDGASLPDATGDELVELITRTATDQSLRITPAPVHDLPEGALYRTQDGTNAYERRGRIRYTSTAILDAESTVLTAGSHDLSRPLEPAEFEHTLAGFDGKISKRQIALARDFVTNPRQVTAGIGPAGTGKTTSMKLAARAAEAGGVRLIGLAPSAAAAAVFRDAVGVPAQTIDAFLVNHDALPHDPTGYHASGGTPLELRPGDVIVVDEAGMAGTRKLAAIVDVARELGVHVRLMGDHRQLSAVDAGGMFPLFVRHHGAAELDQVFRFKDKAEAAASIMLRDPETAGDPFAWYKEQGRVVAGTEEQMVQKVYEAWQHDVEVGHSAIMVAATNTQVDQLNKRAQAYQAAAGKLARGRTTRLREGNNGHEGDLILTRHNNTRIKYNGGTDFVRNGDQWWITKIYRDGSLQVSHTANHGSVRLPAEYVTDNTELGYAITGNRAQGATIEGDSSDDGFQFEGRGHVLLDASVSRNNAYVMATRAVDGNYLYVAVDDTDTSGVDNLTDHPNQVAMDDVLAQIAGNVSTNAAAHDMLRTERERVGGLPQLLGEFNDIAEHINTTRLQNLVHAVLDKDQAAAVIADVDGWPALTRTLLDLERQGVDLYAALAQTLDLTGADGAQEPASESDSPQGLVSASENVVDDGSDDTAAEEATAAAKVATKLRANAARVARRRHDGARMKLLGEAVATGHHSDTIPRQQWQELTTSAHWPSLLRAVDEAETAGLDPAKVTAAALQAMEANRAGRTTEKQKAKFDAARVTAKVIRAITRDDDKRFRAPVTLEFLPEVPRFIADLSPLTATGAAATYPADAAANLRDRHARIRDELTDRGQILAHTRPDWTAPLGPVPADPAGQAEWVKLAGIADAYRTRYQVPDTETRPVPSEHAIDGSPAKLLTDHITRFRTGHWDAPEADVEQLRTAAAAAIARRHRRLPDAPDHDAIARHAAAHTVEELRHDLGQIGVAQIPEPGPDTQTASAEALLRRMNALGSEDPHTPDWDEDEQTADEQRRHGLGI
ncbi:MobF family relaxase [Microbacterium sp. NPDC089698]|uniref:MobF family relaxase n=1 Tax=Microbacterium sp. NPDC089698 TaxID=3364200 RepID=UPI00382C7938